MSSKKNIFFVTSTGTDLGKTFISKNIIEIFKKKNITISPYKPIISGVNRDNIFSSDSAKLLKVLQSKVTIKDIYRISPWVFKKPIAPTLAAKKEKKELKYLSVKDWLKKEINILKTEYALIEGAGGLLVPIGQKKTFLNLIHELELPVVLVVGNYLGAISHTISLIKNIELLKIKVINIVLNEHCIKQLKIEETESILRENLNRKYKIIKIYTCKNKNAEAFRHIYQNIIKFFK